eukprot:TRINITY_DN20179_c0_g1_i1.p1 TRINITY_DN20179_c0_g1~~TRINITY_DN20179_c0_g1_i1.p1  ORF type:complete len:223 (-),score=39.43 TRINITY_DN20179_c0_g1_i1:8-676(-)
MQKLQEYFNIKYPREYNFVLSYFNSSRIIENKYVLNFLGINPDGVMAGYDLAKLSASASKSEKAGEKLKYYCFSYGMMKSVVSTLFTKFFPLIKLTNDMIVNSSGFQLNSKLFAQVIPDLYIEQGNINITAVVKTMGKASSFSISPENDQFYFKLPFSISFYDNSIELLESVSLIGVSFRPALSVKGGERNAMLFMDMNSFCLLYTSPSPRDATLSRMPSSA